MSPRTNLVIAYSVSFSVAISLAEILQRHTRRKHCVEEAGAAGAAYVTSRGADGRVA